MKTQGEKRVQIWSSSQLDQSKRKHFVFFPYCDRHIHTSASEAIFLMHLTDKALFQPNFRKWMNLAGDWKFKIWGFLFVCLLALFCFTDWQCFSVSPWPSLNSLYRLGWPWTWRPLKSGIKGVHTSVPESYEILNVLCTVLYFMLLSQNNRSWIINKGKRFT